MLNVVYNNAMGEYLWVLIMPNDLCNLTSKKCPTLFEIYLNILKISSQKKSSASE